MTLFLLTLGFMLLIVLAMSIGVMLTGRRLKGSCGGLASGSCACRDQGIEPGPSCPRTQPSGSKPNPNPNPNLPVL